MNYENIKDALQAMDFELVSRVIISQASSSSEEYKKIVAEKTGESFHITSYTQTQAFHRNVKKADFTMECLGIVEGHFRQVNIFGADGQNVDMLISKKGQVHVSVSKAKGSTGIETAENFEYKHNREKNYLIKEGEVIPALVDMGVFTKDGKVVRSMYDKFKQINRFIEIIDDACKALPDKEWHIIDFGCGKSYLTFIVYHYFTRIKQMKVKMIGLDLKADVIKHCNETAEKYGYDGLEFEVGNINGFDCPFDVDMVMTLHACDTATDFALYNAVSWNAKMIFSVPCCQHEFNKQMKTEELSLITRYGIIKERVSALYTDAVRANLLEYCGYKTQLLEFIDLEHTPKNILIRAVKKPNVSAKDKAMYMSEVESLMQQFNLDPTLYNLIKKVEK